MLFDALGLQLRQVSIRPRASNPLSGERALIRQPQAIAANCAVAVGAQYAICAQALEQRLLSDTALQLIDVRDGHEHLAMSLGGINLPLSELPQRLAQGLAPIETVVYCKSGVRSLKALHAISAVVGSGRCRSLTGGLDAYLAAGCQERLRRAEVRR
ncbi:rhodanese-like domain-containing protein [Pseudomonas sp. R3-52-08]|uniref:rhodanese-like domain-containing protein n=1 Tax=Pseudomonas sp. R3-52-08 TaxID=1173284 RepID=UPI000F71AC63|nr:rhodanese-like domain-containing protein [Pseudomonas sp. R3-52-08]AZF22980.1 Sulfur carrier protein adenylyltransferase ThiF [Pseudomonas sp. R3-52-08]